jgi:hypothetical protein
MASRGFDGTTPATITTPLALHAADAAFATAMLGAVVAARVTLA